MDRKNSKGHVPTYVLLAAVAAFAIGGLVGWSVKPNPTFLPAQAPQTPQSTAKADNLSKDIRKLWEDHITWTRMFIVSAAYDNKDTDNVAQRLLKNQEDIGDAMKAYYGEDAGNKLTELLKNHILLASDLVTAAKKGDKDAQSEANDKWYANANEIADFLSAANPNWPKNEARAMMQKHLDLTKQEAVDILNKEFDNDISDYDKVHNQILTMADMLTEGIIKQFPDKFR